MNESVAGDIAACLADQGIRAQGGKKQTHDHIDQNWHPVFRIHEEEVNNHPGNIGNLPSRGSPGVDEGKQVIAFCQEGPQQHAKNQRHNQNGNFPLALLSFAQVIALFCQEANEQTHQRGHIANAEYDGPDHRAQTTAPRAEPSRAPTRPEK